ncbi:unnamed protein product, partial [Candidula unifasciata]
RQRCQQIFKMGGRLYDCVQYHQQVELRRGPRVHGEHLAVPERSGQGVSRGSGRKQDRPGALQ